MIGLAAKGDVGRADALSSLVQLDNYSFHISAIMAGGAVKYRHLGRSSAHRQALLKNLVTSLIEHESIRTTWHKAKEAQRKAEKLITLGKRNTPGTKASAQTYVFVSVVTIAAAVADSSAS